MAKTYSQVIRDGGGRVEYLAHIHGYDWAVATCDGLDAFLAGAWLDTTVARTLFGKYYHGAPAVYPADDVEIRSGLEPPGEQVVKLSSTQGLVETSDWSLAVRHGEYGLPGSFGLPNLHDLADPRQNSGIAYGTLSRSLKKAHTEIYVTEATGIHAYVQASKPCPIWIGHECVFATDSTDLGDDEIEIEVARYGDASGEVGSAWRSRCQSAFLDDYGAGVPIMVSDRPLFGAVGRPITLWAIVLSPDGSELWDIARARSGRVSTSLHSEEGRTAIGCDGWTDWLRTPIRSKSAQSHLRGYLLTRPSSDTIAPIRPAPHLVLKYYSAAATISTDDFWFCNAGTSVWFDTYAELVDHVNTELALCFAGASAYGNPTLTDIFYLEDCKLQAVHGFGSDSWCAGTLPWAFGWGWFPQHYVYKTDLLERLRRHGNSGFTQEWDSVHDATLDTNDPSNGQPFLKVWRWGSLPPQYTIGPGYLYTFLPDHPLATTPHPGAADYYYQYPWDDDDEAAFEFVEGITSWPLADTGAGYELFFKPEESIDTVSADEILSFDLVNKEGKVDSVDAVANSITFANTDGYGTDAAGNPGLRWRNQAEWFYFTPQVGCQLSHCKWLGGDDPWVLYAQAQVSMNSSDAPPSSVFRAMLGDEQLTTAALPERAAADHIPDAVGVLSPLIPAATAYDHLPTIDWDSFDAVCGPALLTGSSFGIKLPDESDLLFSQILEGFCLTQGVSPTWEYDPVFKMWRMRFRQMGISNVSEAELQGRLLDSSNIVGGKQRLEHTRYNQFSKIDYNGAYDGREFKLALPTNSTSAMQSTGGRAAALTVNDYVTQYADPQAIADTPSLQEQIKDHFAMTLLARLAQPAPTVTFETTPQTQLSIGCGQSIVITDATVYDPYSSTLGLSSRGAVCTEIKHVLYGRKQRVTLQVAGRLCYGWAPSLSVAVGDSARTAANTVEVTSHIAPADNHWAPVDLPMSDLAYFDCNRIEDGAVAPKDCACGDYLVTLVERDNTTPVVYRDVLISAVDYAAGTATLTAAGLGDDWLANGYDALRWIIYFEDWDHAVEDCQRLWLFGADEDHKLVDAVAAESPGMVWV